MAGDIHYVVSPLYPDDWPDFQPVHIWAPDRKKAVESATKAYISKMGYDWNESEIPDIPEVYGVVRAVEIKQYTLEVNPITTNQFTVERD